VDSLAVLSSRFGWCHDRIPSFRSEQAATLWGACAPRGVVFCFRRSRERELLERRRREKDLSRSEGMKRNPRWMVIAVMVATLRLGMPTWCHAQRLAQRLPEPGTGETIGDPGSPDGNGKNFKVPPGGYALIPVPTGFLLVPYTPTRWFVAGGLVAIHSLHSSLRHSHD
jgi:hypothetical protein